MAKRLIVFASESKAGRELAHAIESNTAIKAMGYAFEKPGKIDIEDFSQAVAYADAVVLDATIEPGGLLNRDRFAVSPLLDHVLIVSRTPLPLNLTSRREGGSPAFRCVHDNRTIVNWLEEQLFQLKSLNSIFKSIKPPFRYRILFLLCNIATYIRSHFRDDIIVNALNIVAFFVIYAIFEYIEFKYLSYFSAFIVSLIFLSFVIRTIFDFAKFNAASMRNFNATLPHLLIDRSSNFIRPRMFVSYRSVDYKDAKIFAQSLKISGEFISTDTEIIIIPPDTIVGKNEIMNWSDRWRLIGQFDRQIEKAGTFLVYDSGDYVKSWWTLAEFTAISQLYKEGMLRQVLVYDAVTKNLHKCLPEKLINLSRREKLQRSWFPVLSDPWQTSSSMRGIRGMSFSPTGLLGQHLDMVEFDGWDGKFDSNMLVPCSECQQQLDNEKDYGETNAVARLKGVGVTSTLDPKRLPAGIFFCDQKHLDEAVGQNRPITCPLGHKVYVRATGLNRYLWYAEPPFSEVKSPDQYLVAKPVYEAVEADPESET